MENYDVVITTYHSLYSYVGMKNEKKERVLTPFEEGLGLNYVVIADECSVFKSVDTKVSRKMRILSMGARGVYGLTATVIENTLSEVYGILSVVKPGIFPSSAYFERKFCEFIKIPIRTSSGVRWHKKLKGYKNVQEFKRAIAPAYYGRLQTDKEVAQQLPEDMTKDIYIEMTVEQSRKVVEVLNGIVELGSGDVVKMDKLAALMFCQQMVNSPVLKGFSIPSAKEEALMEMLSNSLSGEKVVVFSKLRSQIDRLEGMCTESELKCVRITGAEGMDEREHAKNIFNDLDSGVNVLLLNKAGQRALNLQGGKHLIFYDLPWSAGQYIQLVGRLKRTGSLNKFIGVYRFITKLHVKYGGGDTIDGRILEVLMKKLVWVKEIQGDVADLVAVDDLVDEVFAKVAGRKNGAL